MSEIAHPSRSAAIYNTFNFELISSLSPDLRHSFAVREKLFTWSASNGKQITYLSKLNRPSLHACDDSCETLYVICSFNFADMTDPSFRAGREVLFYPICVCFVTGARRLLTSGRGWQHHLFRHQRPGQDQQHVQIQFGLVSAAVPEIPANQNRKYLTFCALKCIVPESGFHLRFHDFL